MESSFGLHGDVERQLAGESDSALVRKAGQNVGVDGDVDEVGQLARTLRLGAQRERRPIEVDQVVFGAEGDTQMTKGFYG